MKLITAVLREDAVDEVQIALAQQGISGMTVSEVSGYARQRGHTEVYRGEEFSIDFIAKIRIDILAHKGLVYQSTPRPVMRLIRPKPGLNMLIQTSAVMKPGTA